MQRPYFIWCKRIKKYANSIKAANILLRFYCNRILETDKIEDQQECGFYSGYSESAIAYFWKLNVQPFWIWRCILSAGPQPTKYLSKDTNLETLLKEGHINQRMAAAVTFAFIEVYGLGETPKTIVLADLSRMSRRILLRQPNFGERSVERIEKLCQMVGIQLLDQKTSLLK